MALSPAKLTVVRIIISLSIVNSLQKIPYIFFDFDYINDTGIWENRGAVRTQIATDDTVIIDDTYPTSTTTDNNGLPIGVFACDNQNSGSSDTTPNTAAYLPELTFNEFTLEVIVKPTVNDVKFHGYIIGIEGTFDNIHGDSISYNQIYNRTSEQSNKFFPSNIINDGWMATSTYWDSTINTNPINITKFHQVIVTQNVDGLVTVYVNGIQYGTSYFANGGKKDMVKSDAAIHIKLCGDSVNIGFDGYIRAFAFYTESFTSLDAANSCAESSNMVYCETASPTSAPTTSVPTTSQPSNSPTTLIPSISSFTTDSSNMNPFNQDPLVLIIIVVFIFVFVVCGVVIAAIMCRKANKRSNTQSHYEHDVASGCDPATGLPMKSILYQKLVAFCNNNETNVAVCSADMDGMKQLNDTLGHNITDNIIKSIADIMNKEAMENQHIFVFRMNAGGDEFAMIKRNTDSKASKQWADDLRNEIDGSTKASISIGVAMRKNNETKTQWFNRAEQALLRAKKQGKNQVVLAENYNIDVQTKIDL